jgi:hypothetical protein
MAKSCFCCSRATNGYEAAAPPSSVMNSRRLIPITSSAIAEDISQRRLRWSLKF